MIFLGGKVFGFGKLSDLALDFREGINLVFAPNEGGKSTLQHFLIGLLYGQLRPDLKTQRRLDPWADHYKPWYGGQYGGVLHCRTADGRDLEIRRFFGREESRLEIRTSTGEDITRLYGQQRNGEVLFGKHHFGLPKDLYESLGVIRENRAAELGSRATIRDRIANLAHCGHEDLSIRKSLDRLAETLESIGSERAPTKPYKQAIDLVRALELERKALDQQRARYGEWLAERNRLAGEARELDRELSRVRGSLLSVRRQDLDSRIRSLEQVEAEIAALRRTIDALDAREGFPVESLEEIDRLAGARDSIAERLRAVRSEKERSLGARGRAEAERRELEAYAPLAAGDESEKVTGWFVQYLGLSLEKEGLRKTAARFRREMDDLEKRLAPLPAPLKDPGVDWDGFARDAAEAERLAAASSAALAELAARENLKMAESVRTAFNRRLAAVVCILLAAAPTAVRYLDRFEGLSPWLELGFGGAGLALSAWLWTAAAGMARRGRAAGERARALALEQAATLQAGGTKRRELDAAVAGAGFRGLDAFLKAARRSEQDRRRLAELAAQFEENQQRSRRYQAQAEETFCMMRESLEKAGLSCSPGSLKLQVDVLRNNLRRFRELDAQYDRCLQKVDSLEAEEAALEGERILVESRIRTLLDAAGVDTPARFREECSKKRRLTELLEKEASRTREFQRLAEGCTLGQWGALLEEADDKLRSHGAGEGAASFGASPGASGGAPLLPYPPGRPELEEAERRLMERLSDARQEHAHAVERVRHAFAQYRSSAEIEEDLAVAATRLATLERNRSALGTAMETIEKLSRQQQEVLAPELNAAAGQRFLRLCRGRYSEVKIDPDFRIRVREAATGELRLAECLSRGTQDQLYFAVRFGILDLVSDGSEPCPCLLDEPFAAYDRPRLLEAYAILDAESERRQLLLFTCREDLLEIARGRNAHILRLES